MAPQPIGEGLDVLEADPQQAEQLLVIAPAEAVQPVHQGLEVGRTNVIQIVQQGVNVFQASGAHGDPSALAQPEGMDVFRDQFFGFVARPAAQTLGDDVRFHEALAAIPADIVVHGAVIVGSDMAQLGPAVGADQQPFAQKAVLRGHVAAGKAMQKGFGLDPDAGAVRTDIHVVVVAPLAGGAVPHPPHETRGFQVLPLDQVSQPGGRPCVRVGQGFGQRKGIEGQVAPVLQRSDFGFGSTVEVGQETEILTLDLHLRRQVLPLALVALQKGVAIPPP